MAAGKWAGRLQGAKELLADRSSCLCFDQTICFLGSEETANVHAVRASKCSGMFKRKVWNHCLMFLTTLMKSGLDGTYAPGFQSEGAEGGRERPGLRAVTGMCPGLWGREDMSPHLTDPQQSRWGARDSRAPQC